MNIHVQDPLLSDIAAAKEVLWCNGDYGTPSFSLTRADVQAAAERLQRFSPYIAKIWPETNGIIESPLVPIPAMQQALEQTYQTVIPGNMLLKLDSHLPISGSVKARGGIYEVMKHAEQLALQAGKLSLTENYAVLAEEHFRTFFSQYRLAVGSTGNLGLSIGIIGAQLGFQTTVHMSADAALWKKELLRQKGVIVKEYASDYSKAVEAGRTEAQADSFCYFVDDENSKDLFLGYATAAARLQQQLQKAKIAVTAEHPLFVYLPCGVGGAPGGIAFGLKLLYGPLVHCFFAEPTQSPCMLLGLLTKRHDRISVQDIGLDNITAADGLAVGRPSRFISQEMSRALSGIYTVEDHRLFSLLRLLADTEQILLEPSALAGMYGPVQLLRTKNGKDYASKYTVPQAGTHLVWGTGGGMVPPDIMHQYYERALRG